MILPGTYANGFAPRDGSPLYPELWRGCVGAWNPGLGVSGLTLRDQSGFNRHGTLTNGPTFAANQGRYAMSFDGINDYVSIGNSIAGLSGFAITVSAMVRSQLIGSNQFILDASTDPSVGNGVSIRIRDNGTIRFWNYNANFNANSTGTLSANTWYHVAATWDANISRIYINGVADGTNTGDSNLLGNTYRIGHSAVLGGPFNGNIDDIRIYNRALSAQEIRTLATRRGIAYEMAPRRRSSVQVTTNRLRRALIGS